MTLPKITISRSDRTRLVPVAIAALDRAVPAASVLLSEIDRAEIVADELMPPDVVRMHSEVETRDNISKTSRRLRLVFPEEAGGGSSVSGRPPGSAGVAVEV